MKKVLALLLFALLVFSTQSMAYASEVALTSVGQSPDAMMIRVVLRNMGIEHDYDSLMKAGDLSDQKVLILVVGGSSKGLGAAGIDKEEEKERAIKLINTARNQGMKILVMHVGGEGRRGQLSDMFIETVTPLADSVIVVKGGNNDGFFDKLTKDSGIPMHEANSIKETDAPLRTVLLDWGIVIG
ncbi:MAG: hypothetical protein H5T90_07425 [Acetomicrobium sp.]|nr:hypothetical protein [Acetomicrobium sp.]